MEVIFENLLNFHWQQLVMWTIGGVLIYLAIKKDMEPTLLLPLGFGTILVNLPLSGAVTQLIDGVKEIGIIDVLFNAGISNELFPLLLFIGIGAMIDFTPLLTNPKMLFFGAAAQFGIFFTFSLASFFGFDVKDAAAIGIIGAADGPTSIFVANYFNSKYIGAIVVAAYSYMALVPIIQPFVIRLITTKNERLIRMEYSRESVPKIAKILFPIVVTIVAGLVAPRSVALIGFLMFGNLIRECGVLNSLSETAQKELLLETKDQNSNNIKASKELKFDATSASNKGNNFRAENKKKKLSFKEQKEYEQIDGIIADLEKSIAAVDAEILEASSNYERLQELLSEKEQLEKKLDEAMERWVYLNELVESFSKE